MIKCYVISNVNAGCIGGNITPTSHVHIADIYRKGRKKMSKEIVSSEHPTLKTKNDWYQITEKGLKIEAPPSYEEWEQLGYALAFIDESLAKCIGDWVNIGEGTFGERYSQALNVFGEKSYGHVANCASTMKRVAYEDRIGDLSFSHLQVVAPLPPAEQRKWQQKAIDNGWTAAELRRQINPPASPIFTEAVSRLRDAVRKVIENQDQFQGGITEKEEQHLDNALQELNKAIKERKG